MNWFLVVDQRHPYKKVLCWYAMINIVLLNDCYSYIMAFAWRFKEYNSIIFTKMLNFAFVYFVFRAQIHWSGRRYLWGPPCHSPGMLCPSTFPKDHSDTMVRAEDFFCLVFYILLVTSLFLIINSSTAETEINGNVSRGILLKFKGKREPEKIMRWL